MQLRHSRPWQITCANQRPRTRVGISPRSPKRFHPNEESRFSPKRQNPLSNQIFDSAEGQLGSDLLSGINRAFVEPLPEQIFDTYSENRASFVQGISLLCSIPTESFYTQFTRKYHII